GRPLTLPREGDPAELLRALRRELHAIGTPRERESVGQPAANARDALIEAVDPAQVRAGVEALALLGHTADGKQIRAGRILTGSP
ncbi:hypothetical protein ABTF60_19410, partial [Acinetobacter baumannii]